MRHLPKNWPPGIDLVQLDVVDSTMEEAARRAPPARPIWIVARHQTAGRGRGGKAWQHPQGNFAATWLSPVDRSPAEVSLTSFTAALAVYDALGAYVAPERLSLKWPNDVLLDGHKVAGILLESSGFGQGMRWLAVGVGINLLEAPHPRALPDGAIPPISLAEAGAGATPPLTPEVMLGLLAVTLEAYLKLWREAGFDTIRRLWLGRAARLGAKIRVALPHETLSGRFQTVDADGCLVLQMAEGPRRISAGEVFLHQEGGTYAFVY
ncbi:MAG: biotin--[acetyl-CoA-carboxylase] ligase [Rhodobacteraceae bacterium]|nr:biotin--[acetyl-CoA-carboxylase] ligase [Paracoccaceae bacterium]